MAAFFKPDWTEALQTTLLEVYQVWRGGKGGVDRRGRVCVNRRGYRRGRGWEGGVDKRGEGDSV